MMLGRRLTHQDDDRGKISGFNHMNGPVWLDQERQRVTGRGGRPIEGPLFALHSSLRRGEAFLYNFLRAGEQVIGGLDPNFTVNAWGGPGYFGAMFAHYLDALYLLYIEAFLLNLVLVRGVRLPSGRNQVTKSDDPAPDVFDRSI